VCKRHKSVYWLATILVGRRPIPIINPMTKAIHGRGNVFEAKGTAIFVNCRVDILGNHNAVIIEDFCLFHNVTFLIRGDHNTIRISESVRFNLGGSLHIEDCGCIIEIGRQSTFEDTHIAATEPNSTVVVGQDCMFAYDVDVRTGDSHSIIDLSTNRRVNYAQNIRIGDHVWVGPHCSILKGVEVRKNCVLATRSVLTKTFDREGVILGGSPAKILKENITWDRRRLAGESDGNGNVSVRRKMEGPPETKMRRT
jgi:acetyltransferase-like isoleucine patch superfamily enzyme